MDLYDLTLSAGPPFIALALQKWGIPSNRALARHAASEQAQIGLSAAGAKRIENNLRGAVAENNLAVTLVSLPSGMFALFRAVHDKLGDEMFYFYILLAVFGIGILWMMNMIGGRSLHDIVVGRFRSFRQKPGKRFLSIAPINVINGAIYGSNILLIVMAGFFYLKFKS